MFEYAVGEYNIGASKMQNNFWAIKLIIFQHFNKLSFILREIP